VGHGLPWRAAAARRLTVEMISFLNEEIAGRNIRG
jgi:hypothetical protein